MYNLCYLYYVNDLVGSLLSELVRFLGMCNRKHLDLTSSMISQCSLWNSAQSGKPLGSTIWLLDWLIYMYGNN